MSFFCEEAKPDLSGRTDEELTSLRTELDEKRTAIGSQLVEFKKKLRVLDKEYNDIDKDLKYILKEIKRREDIEEAKNVINEDINKIEGFGMLSEDELSIITKNMDRTDYRKYGNYPRFYDLERICKEVIKMKTRYPKWSLKDLGRGGQYDTCPPQTFYRYEYKDEFGNYFKIGGINIVSR